MNGKKYLIVSLLLLGASVFTLRDFGGAVASSKSVYSNDNTANYTILPATLPLAEVKSLHRKYSLDTVDISSGVNVSTIRSVLSLVHRQLVISSDTSEVKATFLQASNNLKSERKVSQLVFCRIARDCFTSLGIQARVVKRYTWNNEGIDVHENGCHLEVLSTSDDKWILYDPAYASFVAKRGKYLGSAELVSELAAGNDGLELLALNKSKPVENTSAAYFDWFNRSVDLLLTSFTTKSRLSGKNRLDTQILLHRMDEQPPSTWLRGRFSERPLATFSSLTFNLHI